MKESANLMITLTSLSEQLVGRFNAAINVQLVHKLTSLRKCSLHHTCYLFSVKGCILFKSFLVASNQVKDLQKGFRK